MKFLVGNVFKSLSIHMNGNIRNFATFSNIQHFDAVNCTFRENDPLGLKFHRL